MNCRLVVGTERVGVAHVSVTKKPSQSQLLPTLIRWVLEFLAFHCRRPSASRGSESEAGISEKIHKKPSKLSMAAWGCLAFGDGAELLDPGCRQQPSLWFSCLGSGGGRETPKSHNRGSLFRSSYCTAPQPSGGEGSGMLKLATTREVDSRTEAVQRRERDNDPVYTSQRSWANVMLLSRENRCPIGLRISQRNCLVRAFPVGAGCFIFSFRDRDPWEALDQSSG